MFKKEIFKNTVISSDKKKFDLDGAHFLINHSRIRLVKRFTNVFSKIKKKKTSCSKLNILVVRKILLQDHQIH